MTSEWLRYLHCLIPTTQKLVHELGGVGHAVTSAISDAQAG